MKPISLALSAIVIVILTAIYECRAQNAQPPAVPASPPATVPAAPPPTPQVQRLTTVPAKAGPVTAAGSPGQRCVQHTRRGTRSAREVALKEVNDELKTSDRPTGPDLVSASYFMPAGAPFKVAINEEFDEARRYFGYVQPFVPHSDPKYLSDVNMEGFIEGGQIGAVQIPDDDALVKARLVDPGTTLLTVRVPDSVGGFWTPIELFIWSCEGVSVKQRSSLKMRATSGAVAGMVTLPVVFVIYFLAALATKRTDVKSGVPWIRYFNPIYMTAGTDGKGSLSKLQILFFSLIVFGLLSFIVARTGVLSDLSSSILLLLGIAGVGSTAAKGADDQKSRLSTENRVWLIAKGWLPPAGWAAINRASWHDIITNDGGEFDVYRYQSCIFSLTVGGALLLGGVNELASFTIPQTLLGILGLSQAVYISGKLVSTSSISELDDAVTKARTAEKTYIDATIAPPAAGAAAGAASAVDSSLVDYKTKVQNAKILFETLTGRTVAAN